MASAPDREAHKGQGGYEAGFNRVLVSVVIAIVATISVLDSQTSTSRFVVIASDLHFGVGRSASGEWLPAEDFRWPDEFAAFLRAVDEAGKGATDLVLNGDTFELLQSTTDDCRVRDARLGCTEAEARGRLERVVAAHSVELAALGTFARNGTNRLILVPGDHDAALLFPAVAARAIASFNAPERVEVATRGYWLSADGAVYAEHGHQLPGDPYAFTAWPDRKSVV